MLNFAKKPLPMIGKLSEMLVFGNRAGFLDDVTSSPRGPLDLKLQSPSSSPKALKIYDVGGVGLGIAAVLEKSSSNNGRFCSHSSIKSDHIPVVPGENSDEGNRELEEEDSEENYTFVTCHGSNKSVTKVYYDGGDCRIGTTTTTKCHVINDNKNHKQNRAPVYPTSEFLSSCHLCSKRLDGLDIYMYREDKAFCSTECRATHMTNDERQERCRSEASRRSADVVSSSTYEKDQIFFYTAIFAI